MKRLSFLGAVLVVACGGDEGVPPHTPSPALTAPTTPAASTTAPPVVEAPAPKLSHAEEMKKTLLASNAASNAHDVKAAIAHYSKDAVKEAPTPAGWKEARGAELEQQMQMLFSAAPDAKWTYTRALQRADVVATEYVVSGTRDGKKVGVRGLALSWFDDAAKIRKERVYIDQMSFMVQTGRVPGVSVPTPEPTGEPVWIVAKGDATEDKLVETFKGGWPVAWAKKDRKGYEALLTDDFVQEDIGWGMTFKGKSEAAKGMDGFVKAVPDVNVTVDSVWAAGDVVVAEITMKGTHKGPLGPLKGTGRPFTSHLANVAEYKDGKLARSHVYMNTMELLTQLGVGPQPPGGASAAKPEGAKPAGVKPEGAKPAGAKPEGAKPTTKPEVPAKK